MSLDTLLRDAAEAGGPPRFDEDDVARRVRTRHRRRRSALAVGAAVVVLAGGIAGLALAAQGGDGVEPTEDPDVIGIAPATEADLLGGWTAVDASGETPTLTFSDDGTAQWEACAYQDQSGAGSSFGVMAWNLVDGRIGTELVDDPEREAVLAHCPTDHHALADGLVTYYTDGLLRFASREATLDFVRDDDTTPPDPNAAREEVVRPVVATEDAVVGAWVPLGGSDDGAVLDLAADGTMTSTGCNDVEGTWALDEGRVRIEVGLTTRVGCDESGSPSLRDAVDGLAVLDSAGELVVQGDDGVLFLVRQDGVDPVPATGFTDTRWVANADDARAAGGAAWIDLADDGTYSASTPCGVATGTWVPSGDGARLTMTEPDDGGLCAQPDAGSAVRIAEVQPVAGGLLARSDPIPSIDGSDPIVDERLFVDLAALPVPTAEQLVGEWSSAHVTDTDQVRSLIRFEDDGTAVVGPCTPRLGWELADDVLQVDVPDDDCLEDLGFHPPEQAYPVRLDGEVLYLTTDEEKPIGILVRGEEVFHDTQLTVDGAEVTLQNAYAELGVQDCCREALGGVDHVRHGFVWEGHQVLVQADILRELDGLEDLQERTVELDGEVVSGQTSEGPVWRFDCGGYRFTLSPWIADVPPPVMQGAVSALIDVLPCDAEAPLT